MELCSLVVSSARAGDVRELTFCPSKMRRDELSGLKVDWEKGAR